MPDEGRIAIGVWGWFPRGTPLYNAGRGQTSTVSSLIDLQGEPKLGRGADVTVPGGRFNFFRISYFDTTAAGNVASTANDLNLWSTPFAAGDYLATQYKLKNVKVSYDFLTWPYPPGNHRFRFKTLWQVQYVSINSTFSAPLSTTDTSVGTGKKSVILPTLGVGVAEYLSPNFRVEANVSGFAIPRHSTIWDADASAAYRVGRAELRVGVKGFHFKTSTATDFYMRSTFTGGFVGVRLFLN